MNSKLVMGLVGVIIIGLGSVNIYQYTNYNKERATYEQTLQDLMNSQTADTGSEIVLKEVVGLVNEVNAGKKILDEDIQMISMPEANVPENAIVNIADLKGKQARVDLKPNTVITPQLIADVDLTVTSRLRQIYYDYASTDIIDGDYVDVRLFYPTGEDYIVFSRVQVEKSSGNYVELMLNEGQYNLSKSMYMDYLNGKDAGVKIYLDKYIDPLLQKPSKVTYVSSDKIKQIVYGSPNVVDKVLDSNNSAVRQEIEKLNREIKRGVTLDWQSVQPEGKVTQSKAATGTGTGLQGFNKTSSTGSN